MKQFGLLKPSLLALSLAGLLGTASLSHAQITVTSSTDALALAKALIQDPSISIVSATYTGANGASGFFSGGSSQGVLPFKSGVILTNGSVNVAVGPNGSTGFSTSNSLAGDPLLTALAGGATNDASILEIHFVPKATVISFQYVFGSEEYPEFVNSYNDAFGFFLNGKNIALIPGTAAPVTINSVNDVNAGSNPLYYYSNTGATLNTELDGLVGRNLGYYLYASGTVNAGVDNVIHISIADALDTKLDSAVFLAGGSFINQPPIIDGAVPEPSTYGMIGAGVLLVGVMLRRWFSKR